VRFIEQHKDHPFFLYLAHNAPHVPLHVSDKYRARSQRGLYGDVCMEIDWSVGEVLSALQRNGIDDHTLVIFFSDNGPWLTYGNHAGSAGPLRNGKTTSYEGGFRVPCIMRWPGHIPTNRLCREITSAIDLLPTLTKLVGAPSPAKKIDGKDIWPLMSGEPRAKSPHEAFFYYNAWQLDAVRSGQWKVILPMTYYAVAEPGKDGLPGKQVWTHESLALFDLQNDIGEQTDVALEHPDVIDRLLRLVAAVREDIGDGVMRVNPEKKDFFQARQLYRIPGKNSRPAEIVP
jgi:arylsulfatase A-like enzyme